MSRPTTIGDTSDNADSIAEIEAWFRRRTDIDDRIGDAKIGAAVRDPYAEAHPQRTRLSTQ